MSAAILDVRRRESSSQIPLVSLDSEFFPSRIGVRLREQRCPLCNSVVYTRRHGRCGVCERALPASFLFTSDEAEKVDVLIRTERERHKAWLMRMESAIASQTCAELVALIPEP